MDNGDPAKHPGQVTDSEGQPDRTLLSSAWVVWLKDAGLDWAHEQGRIAIDCKVHESAAGLREYELRPVGGDSRHPSELHRFVTEPRLGETVLGITTVDQSRDVLVGVIAGDYEFRPDLRAGQPHQRRVGWQDRLNRLDLEGQGIRFPTREVVALARLVGGRVRSTPALPARPVRSPWAKVARAAPPDAGTRPPLDPRTVPHRQRGPRTWTDEEHAVAPRMTCPTGTCCDHTEHRYLLDVPLPKPIGGGPHVLVVGTNPSCPDDLSARFLGSVRDLADDLGAASCGIVNLLSRRTRSVALLKQQLEADPDLDLVGGRQRQVLEAAVHRVDLVVLAHGVTRHGGEFGRQLEAHKQALHEFLREPGAPVAAHVGDRTSHPSRHWDRLAGPAASHLSRWIDDGP